MFVIWGFGKVTRKIIGGVSNHTCTYCNQTSMWNLCVVRTWFTLFFIPIIPYKTSYQIACPNCNSFVELTKEQFIELKNSIENKTPVSNFSDISNTADASNQNDDLKYQGKTETQINYLKEMERLKNNAE